LRRGAEPEAMSITVAAPARLHLGFLDPSGGLGRRFAGIGLALGELGTRINVRIAASTHIEGPEQGRVQRYLDAMRQHLGVRDTYAIRVEETVAAHVGLGSGTQIALAVAAGIRRLHDLPLDVIGDAVRLGRGGRSGIGIGVFERGGLILDGGRGSTTTTPPIIARLPFPEAWRVILVLDTARKGLHGAHEGTAFESLPRFPDAEAAHHCRLVLMQALPAVLERDLTAFSAAIRDLQQGIGDYFAPVQGGSRFFSPDVAAALARLDAAGAHGIGQSSWGPTGFAFAQSDAAANELTALLGNEDRFRALDIRICSGLNRGAEIVAHAVA